MGRGPLDLAGELPRLLAPRPAQSGALDCHARPLAQLTGGAAAARSVTR
jgi:hypothetical protein